MCRKSLAISGMEESALSFTAQRYRIHRGILETIYFRASDAISSPEDLLEILLVSASTASQGNPCEYIRPCTVPDLRAVLHTNFAILASNSMQVLTAPWWCSAIDNLGKGAAWQAVQNLNLALGIWRLRPKARFEVAY